MYNNKHLYIIAAISLFLIFPNIINNAIIHILRHVIGMLFYTTIFTMVINTGLYYFYYGMPFRTSIVSAIKYTVELYLHIITIVLGFIFNKMFRRR